MAGTGSGPKSIRVVSVSGSPRQMGEQFGEACRDQLPEFYARRVQNALGSAREYGKREASEAELIEVARASLEATGRYHPEGLEELRGIAAGAGMSVEQVLATNGLTDYRDVLTWPYPDADLDVFGGCSAFVASREVTREGRTLCGQTWDLATDNMPYVLAVHRRPTVGPSTWCLTTVGCLSLIGMNDAGIAVGTTNLRTQDPRPGVMYLSILHKMLSTRTLEEAERAVVDAPRAGAHFFFASGPDGVSSVIECSARKAHPQRVSVGFYGHCNHALVEEVRALEPRPPAPSSAARTARVDEVLTAARGRFDVAAAKALMSDTANGDNAILRDDTNHISTNGAVVMDPDARTMWAVHGLPDRNVWVEHSFA